MCWASSISAAVSPPSMRISPGSASRGPSPTISRPGPTSRRATTSARPRRWPSSWRGPGWPRTSSVRYDTRMSSDKPALRLGPPRAPRPPTPQVPPAGGTSSWIERFGPWLGLLALCLAVYLPGLASLPPTDRDEARFAQASRQMAETGDLVRIQFQNEPRNKKPILLYWAQAATAALAGEAPAEGRPAILPYRLPSAAGASIAVLLL